MDKYQFTSPDNVPLEHLWSCSMFRQSRECRRRRLQRRRGWLCIQARPHIDARIKSKLSSASLHSSSKYILLCTIRAHMRILCTYAYMMVNQNAYRSCNCTWVHQHASFVGARTHMRLCALTLFQSHLNQNMAWSCWRQIIRASWTCMNSDAVFQIES